MRGERFILISLLLSVLRQQSTSLGRGKSSLESWLLCFSGFQVELQHLTLGFIIRAKFGTQDLGNKIINSHLLEAF